MSNNKAYSQNNQSGDLSSEINLPLDQLQVLQKTFCEATGVAAVLVDTLGKKLTIPENTSRFCADFVLNSNNREVICCFKQTENYIHNASTFKCKFGCACSNSVNIKLHDKVVATWIIGQIRTNPAPDLNFAEMANMIQADPAVLQAAYSDMPLLTEERFEKVAKLLQSFSDQLIERNHANTLLRSQLAESEKALNQYQEQQKNYSDILQTLPQGVAHTTLQGKVISINDSLEKILEISRERVEGRNIIALASELLTIDALTAVLPLLKALILGNTIPPFQVKFRNKVLEITATINKQTNRLTGVVTDVTERMKVESNLRESEDKYRLLVENQSDLVVKIDKFNRFVYVSPSYCKVFGKRDYELIGSSFMPMVHPDDIESTAAEMQKLTKEPHTCQVEQRAMTTKGWRWFSWSDTAEVNKKNEIISVIGVGRDITESKNIELALRESERSKSVLLSNLPGMAYRCNFDPDWTMQFVSEGCLALTGFPGSDFINNHARTYNDLILPEHRQHLWDVWAEAVQLKKAVTIEYRILTADNKVKWVWEQGLPIYKANGEVDALEGLILDITDRKAAEEALIENETKYRLLLENLGMGVVVYDLEGRIQLFNQKALQYLDSEAATYIGKSLENILGSQSANVHIKRIQRAAANSESVDYEDFLTLPTGNFWFVSNYMRVVNNEGKVTGVQVISHNITERRLTEDQLTNERLLLRTLIDNIPDSIYSKDINLRKTLTNPADIRFIGVTNESEVLGKTDHDLFSAEFADKFRDDDLMVLNSGVPLYNREEFVLDENGNVRWLLSSKIPLRNADNQITGLVGIGRDITELKLSEKALQESEEKYRKIFENVQDVFFRINMNGLITDISPSVKHFTEFELSELMSQPINRIYYNPDERTKLLEELTSKGVLNDYELKIRTRSNEVRYGSVNARLVLDSNGNPDHIDGAIRNITERKLAEEKVRKIGQHYQSLIENAPDGIVLLNREGEFLFFSPSALKMFGFEPNDNLSISPNLLTHPDDLPGVLSELAEVVKNPDYVPVLRYRFYGKDGNYRWIESTFSNMLENAAVEAIVINFRDIHERVLAEEELMSQKYFFEQMFTQSSVSTQILDKDGWCEKVNPKLSELFGVKAEDIENHKYNIFKDASIINNGIDTILKKVFEEGGTTDWEVKFDIGQAAESQNITVESPKVAWYYNWAYPLLDKDGKLSKVIIQHHETTSRKATEQALIQAKEKAEESDRLKSAFLANMSHEIRTPMNGILGFAELLKEPNLTGEQQQDYIRIIKKSGDRMLNIINDIIDISKIESGQMVVSLSQVNIREQLEDIYQFFKPETDSKGIAFQLDYQIPEQLSDIETDREKLFAIYINLVKNAIKFTNKGYIKIRIYLNEGQLESCVEDTGIGVEPDRQEAIFERFIQADIHDKHAKQGAGLGLAISKAYIEMLGGKIWMESRVGAGSKFFFKLPLKNVRQLSNDESKKLAATTEHSKMSHLKVLVAEDDETSDLLLTLSIKDICREVIHAVNGNQAVELCRLHHDFDLIFMDIKMPDIDGYEATRQIRQFNKDVIIIAQTAYALTGDEEKSLNAGCNAHITKPLTREKLFRLISDLMRE